MAEKAVIEVEVKGGDSVGSLKKQLREAQQEVQALSDKFGATSEQAVKAAKKAAELKDAIGDAKALTDAFNPDRKFQAFASALQGVVGGISAFQGAMGLLGVKNEEVEKTLLKVNAAMALSQGINSVLEARDSFKNLGAVIQATSVFQKANNAATTIAIALQKAFGVATVQTATSFRILKGAIAATGIGLLVVGLTALISKITEWTSASDKAAEAQKKLAEKNDLVNASIQNQIDVLTALGGKEKEILALKKQQIENELNVIRASVKQKNGFTQEELKQFRDLKTQKEILDINEANRIKKLNEDAAKEQEKNNKEAADKLKEQNDKALKIRQEEEDKRRQLLNDRIDFEKQIQEEQQKIVSNNIKFVEDRTKQFDAIAQKSAEALNNRIKGSVTEQLNARIQLTNELLIPQQQRELDALEAQYNARFALIKGNESAELALTEEFERQKKDVKLKYEQQKLDIVKGALNNIQTVVGKETAAGKAIAVASATIDTYSAANKALNANYGIFGPAAQVARFVAVAATIAAGIKNVKEIVKAKVPGGGASANIPSSISSLASAPVSPQVPGATLTQLDQGTINRLGSATNRAYVVESDVTNSQERIRRINRAARLN